MKENLDDERQENIINIENNENNIKPKKKHQKKEQLHSIATLIDSSDRSTLKTLDAQLNEEYSDYDSDDENLNDSDINTSKNESNNDSATPRIVFNIKNYIFIFCLLFSSFLNYNFLYFPYIILGFILSFFLFRNKNKKIYIFRKSSELGTLFYSILLLIFKIVLIALIKKGSTRVKENKNLYINLGVKILKDEESVLYLVSSFFSECIIIIISLISYIISVCFIDYTLEEEIIFKDKTENEMFNSLIKHLIINYFFFLFFAILNTSIATIVYLSLIGFTFFMTVKYTDIYKLLILFKSVILTIYIILLVQILAINLLNCYTFEDIIAAESIETDSGIKYFSIYSQIGIRVMLKNDTLLKRVVHCLSYFFSILSFISISTSRYAFPYNVLHVKFLKEKQNVEKNDSKNFCNRLRLKIKSYFTSPGFILHICRLFGIAYLYFFRNFFGVIVFIWLFFTFLNMHVRSNKINTFILLIFLYISYLLFHIANIDGFFEKEDIYYYHLSLYKKNERYEYYAYYFGLNLFIFFNILFIFAVYHKNKETDILEPKIDEVKKEKSKLEENLLNKEPEEQNKESKNSIVLIEDENSNKDNKDEEDSSIIKSDELSERSTTSQITTKKSEEDKISKKLKISEETLKNLTLLNIITKELVLHIDKLALIAMYFICLNSINIMHMILVIIFMIQLLFPELIVIISKYLMIIIQILYLAEFAIDISKRYSLDYFNNKEKLIKIFIDYDTDVSKTSVEIYFYIIVYCFYIQYKLYEHKFYKDVVSNDKISLTYFILVKFHSYPKIKSILFFFGKIIIEIYIFILIVLFIFFDTYFEISLLFEIKLVIFFIIVFQFLISIQNPKEQSISLILNWVFLCYCSLNSFLSYGYQIICLDYFIDESEPKSNSKCFMKENLPSIGFSIYKDKLYFRFLPHFICNFISILFLWEMKRILLKTNKEQVYDDLNNEILVENGNKEEKEEKKEELGATQLYEENKKRMQKLDFFYYLYNIALIITKFYWLFLFINLGIIFTTRDLSVILILYILIFGVIYIGMFHKIITKLNAYIKKKSYFISRLIRYNLVELSRHYQQNRYFRNLGFQYLLMLCLISYLFFYTFGLFHRVQNGCNYENNNGKWGWEGCDNRHEKIFNDEDNILDCIAYLLGFYTECDFVFEESWFHLFFAFLICLDIYVLKVENFFNEKVRENREEYKFLLNKNIQLKVLTFGEKNILFNIRHILDKAQDENNNIENEDEKIKEIEKEEEEKRRTRYNHSLRKIMEEKIDDSKYQEDKIKFKLDVDNEDEDERIGKKLIDDFLKIFHKSTQQNDIKLSNSNNKIDIIKVIKKIFEEIIIFFLICTSISKMDVWSFVYLIYSIILITTKKAMIKFYVLYCFMFCSTLIQSLLFVSNIQKSTEPNPNIDLLKDLSIKFNVPWYKHGRVKLDDKMAYFFGLGAAKSQINLIWMEFIEIVIIYIYLDYFSYSIYQEEENIIGRLSNKQNILNYFNLQRNKETKEIALKLTEDEYQKYIGRMKYNFNVDVTSRFKKFEEFKEFMKTGVYHLPKSEEKPELIQESKNNQQLSEIKEEPEEKEDKDLEEKNEENKSEEHNELIITNKPIDTNEKKKKEEEPNSLISNLHKKYSIIKSQHKTLFEESKVKSDDNKNKCFSKFKDFLFLSFHNVILIAIIIISMTISGLFSIFYILFSLYFLITSTSIYLGKEYLYPRAIKTPLRIIILIDILAQISYQSPFLETNNKILEFIGLHKIINYTQIEEKTSSDTYEIQLNMEPLFLVLAKAFIYLLMSFQVLVYSSHNFQEYYFSYIITKNNKTDRISYMNAYQFNNKRIAAMNDSVNLRNDMTESMIKLERMINQWNFDLKKTKSINIKKEKKNLIIVKDETKNLIDKEKEDIEENNEILNDIKPNIKLIGKKKLKLKPKKIKEEIKEENEKEEIKEEQKELPKENENKAEIKEEEKKEDQDIDLKEELNEEKPEIKTDGNNQIFSTEFDKNIEEKIKQVEEEEDKILPKEEVYKKIKEVLLSGFFMKIYLLINKYSSSYMSIKKEEKDLYEKNVIKGESNMVSFIESQIDMKLNSLDLSSFTKREMKEVVHYLDGTREKKLKEKKKKEAKEAKEKKSKEKKKNKKMKKNKVKDNDKNKEEEKKKDNNNNNEEINKEEEKKEGEINNENIEEKEKNKEIIINLEEPKFKQFENLLTSKLFVKYLKKTYIIKCIFSELFSYFLNNFHWLCYLIMLINHIISASLLTLFYPLTIFCYALLEYPRPKKFYWRMILLYTVILLVIKFIIQIELLRSNKSFNDFITILDNYKIGLKIYESNFSSEFLIYILLDALVLIFLLINDYLLISRGIWLKREQEIETIYEANERIATTNLKEHEGKNNLDSEDIKAFNNKYLESSQKKQMKKNLRFSNLLNTDDKNDDESRNDSDKKTEKKHLNYDQLIKGYNLKLSNLKTSRESLKSINDDNIENRLTRKIEHLKEQKRKEDIAKRESDKYDESSRNYFQRLFPKNRNEKPGGEFYVWYTSSMAILIILILIFYTSMVNDKTYGAVELDTKQFSGEMVIVIIIHVLILLYDRVLFINQNRNNLKFEYFFYEKENGKPTENKLKEKEKNGSLIHPKKFDLHKQNYNIIIIQKEEFNYIMLQKYILHMVITILSHGFVFFYCPMIGNYNSYGNVYCPKKDDEESDDDEQCNDFKFNKILIIFYLIYIIYLVSSGLQIKYGFYDMKRKSLLKSGKKSINGIIYNIYKAIPFLYEIKLAIDWTFTKTCLDLFQWNKFESSYDIIYVTFCQMTAKNLQLVGQKVKKFYKIFMGGLLAFVLIILLIVPLMLFSSLNPTNKLNNLTGAVLKIDLCFFYKNKFVQNYTLYENSRPESIDNITDYDFNLYNYSKSVKSKNFDREQIQTVTFFTDSDKNWDLTNPLIENLKYLIINRENISDLEYIALAIDYNFDRPLPVTANKINKRYTYTIYYYNNHTNVSQYEQLEYLGHALEKCYNIELEYKDVYSPPIRLSSNIKPKRLTDPKYFTNLDIKLGFVGCKNITKKTGNITEQIPSYLESYFTLKKVMKINNKTNEEGIKFHVFSDKVSSTTSGRSILTLYISFVLVVGNYVRNFFAGQPEKIRLTEMPYSDKIINLCEGIKVSRNSFDFNQEEKLYYRLIELMRSPEYLRTLTQSSTEQFRRRKEMTKVNKTTDGI